MKDIKFGDVLPSNSSGFFLVQEVKDSRNVLVEFLQTGTKRWAKKSNVVSGRVKDPMFPSLAGVGYLGIGKHKASIDRKSTPAYRCWSAMISRCYSKGSYVRDQCYMYDDVKVCDEWHNFQNFAEWFSHQDTQGKELDKDILGDGKLYSPETCQFVTKEENYARDNRRPRGSVNRTKIR